MRDDALAFAARRCAALGLVDAFGHVSRRIDPQTFLITPPTSLATIDDGTELCVVDLSVDRIPRGVPGETWVHWALYRAFPAVRAICRAQPPSSQPLAAVVSELAPIHGQGAWVSAVVPVHPDGSLLRDRRAAESLVRTLGEAGAVILRGNGAVVVGDEPWEVVTRMWLLERSCRVVLDAMAAGHVKKLDDRVRTMWAAAADEMLPRLWHHLTLSAPTS